MEYMNKKKMEIQKRECNADYEADEEFEPLLMKTSSSDDEKSSSDSSSQKSIKKKKKELRKKDGNLIKDETAELEKKKRLEDGKKKYKLSVDMFRMPLHKRQSAAGLDCVKDDRPSEVKVDYDSDSSTESTSSDKTVIPKTAQSAPSSASSTPTAFNFGNFFSGGGIMFGSIIRGIQPVKRQQKPGIEKALAQTFYPSIAPALGSSAELIGQASKGAVREQGQLIFGRRDKKKAILGNLKSYACLGNADEAATDDDDDDEVKRDGEEKSVGSGLGEFSTLKVPKVPSTKLGWMTFL